MTRPLVTYPRVESIVVDFLVGHGVNAAARLPRDWTVRSNPIVVVASDGVPQNGALTPVAIVPVVRLIGWSNSPTEAHDMVMLSVGQMEAHDGSLFTARFDGGGIAAVDPEHGNAQLFSATLRVRVRSVPV